MRINPADVALCLSDERLGSSWDPGSVAGRSRPATTPIFQTSLFSFPDLRSLNEGLAAEHRHHVYTRGQNPTVEVVEQKLAALEGGEACKCFGSGMAAISAVLFGLLESGDHILFVNQVYGPTLQLAAELRRFGIEHDVVLDLDVSAVERALRPNTRVVWLESPGTMLFRVLDIPAISACARSHGALTCVDNSWATPLLQKPLSLGADIVVHTASKYLAGHSDVMAGAVIASAPIMEQLFYRSYLLLGGLLAPFDAWLLLRGLRTLPVRLAQHEADGLAVAGFLSSHRSVARIHHPALGADRELFERQSVGYTGLFSFELMAEDIAGISAFVDRLERFKIGVSWGGVESLVIPAYRGTNDEALRGQGIPRGLIRLSIGLEGAEALIEDLSVALKA